MRLIAVFIAHHVNHEYFKSWQCDWRKYKYKLLFRNFYSDHWQISSHIVKYIRLQLFLHFEMRSSREVLSGDIIIESPA